MQAVRAIYVEKRFDEEQGVYITFKLNNYQDKEVIKELEKGALYRLNATEVKSKRTIQQNNYMWSLIHDISVARNTDLATSNDDWDVYIEALERAQARFEFVACLPEAVPLMKQQFRAMKEINEFEHNGRTFKQLKVFYGSSKLDVSEMAKLLNTVTDMAIEEGVELKDYWHE